MVKFLSCTELYEVIQQKSSEAKEVLWTCSPRLGLGGHEVFSQEIVKNPPVDVRFVFRFSDVSVKTGEVNPYEVQYFLEHFGNSNVKSNDTFHSTIFVFDNSALITSANLTKAAFESDIEAGVLLDNSEAVEVKSFFEKSLWENAIQVRDFKKYKKIWNTEKRSGLVGQRKKTKIHTKIRNWMDEYVSTWYFSILDKIAKKAERKIHKEANWPKALKLVGDIGPTAFRQVKLGDLAFMADLSKKRLSKINVELARIFDKSRVETNEGDLHLAYETEKTYSVDRNRFYEMLKGAHISAKSSEILLSQEQTKIVTENLSSKKAKKQFKP
jgi:hypothetical protein